MPNQSFLKSEIREMATDGQMSRRHHNPNPEEKAMTKKSKLATSAAVALAFCATAASATPLVPSLSHLPPSILNRTAIPQPPVFPMPGPVSGGPIQCFQAPCNLPGGPIVVGAPVGVPVIVSGATQVASVAAVQPVAPAAQPVAFSAAGCLRKDYYSDGAVLFRDLCTNESAVNQQPQMPER